MTEVIELTHLIPIKDVATKYLGCSVNTARNLVGTGKLPSVRQGQRVMVRADDLQEYMNALPSAVDTRYSA